MTKKNISFLEERERERERERESRQAKAIVLFSVPSRVDYD
jgi:hypothetical protein